MSKNLIQLYNTDPDSFKNEIINAIVLRLDDLEQKIPQSGSIWITRKQASSMLGVSLVTISDWSKKGILKPYRIGNRVRFKLAEIEETLKSSRDEN